MMEIYCIENKKENFDKRTKEDVERMVGWIEPPEDDKGWVVTMEDGSLFECKEQETAQLMAGIEEVKALLLTQK